MTIRPLPDLRPLADETLISQLKSLVRRERAITLAVLLRLVEVERRGLHLRRYSSLFLYCVDRLGYSDSAAGRRIAAARCLREFPRVYEMLLEGRLNLTTLCRVARVLTKENEGDLLQRVAGKSEKEVERIVAALSPPIQPREIIRPIRVRTGNAGNRAPRSDGSAGVSNASESEAGVPNADVSSAHVPSASVPNSSIPNADVLSGDVPSVGVPNANVPNVDVSCADVPSARVPNANVLNVEVSSASVPSALSSASIDVTTSDANGTTSHATPTTGAALSTGSRGDSPVPVAGAAANPPPVIDSSGSEDPLSYRIAITVDEAFMEKLERVRALVSRSRPGVSVADVFCRTLDEFLMRHDPEARMTRRQQRTAKKDAATRGSLAEDVLCNGTGDIPGVVFRSGSGDACRGIVEDAARNVAGSVTGNGKGDLDGDVSGCIPQVARFVDPAVDPAFNPAVDHAAPQASQRFDPDLRRGTPHRSSDPTTHREKVGRGTRGSSSPGFITAAMRDAVWIRDGGRCTYVGPEGRCPETRGLHIDHCYPESLGGVAELWNCRLMCSLHNQSEADRVLGKDFMDLRRRRTPGAGVAAAESMQSTSPQRTSSKDQACGVP